MGVHHHYDQWQQNLQEEAEIAEGGFVRMISSYGPLHSPTYIDEENAEMFVIGQKNEMGEFERVHLTPSQAFELRQKIDAWLEAHFGIPSQVQVGSVKLTIPNIESEPAKAA